MLKNKYFFLFLFFLNWISYLIYGYNNIAIRIGNTLQLGDNIASYCLAKILSYKYSIPFIYTPFLHSDLFVFDFNEVQQLDESSFTKRIRVTCEQDIVNNLDKKNILFWTDIKTKIEYINPDLITKLKEQLKFKQIPIINKIPDNIITVAVHIRKGNGGGQFYDGEQSSLQYFQHNLNIVYLNDYNNYPFDWDFYKRNNNIVQEVAFQKYNSLKNYKYIDNINGYETKFPSEQYYVDQIKKISKDLNYKQLYIQIFTDDKDPFALIERLKNNIKLSNITWHYEDNRSYSFKERILQDLYNISRFDILIRSQSYFARVAEFIGSHKIIIYPLNSIWVGNKLVMVYIVMKGSIGKIF